MSCDIAASVQVSVGSLLGYSFLVTISGRGQIIQVNYARFIFGILQLFNEFESNLGSGLRRFLIGEMGIL